MKREIAAIGLVIGVLLIATVSVPMVAAEGGVTRTLPATAAPGSTITVSLAVTVDGATYYSIDEQVPAGWTVTSASGGGDFTSDPGHIKWLVLTAATNTTYTYTVSIPADVSLGSYTFTGTYMLEGMTEKANIGGDSSITVTTADTTPPTIEFIAPTPADGSEVTVNYVTVNVSVTDSSGVSTVLLSWNGVNETMYMTAGNVWSVNKTNLPDGEYTYMVYANDTHDNWGVSEVKTVTVSTFAYDPADTDHDRKISTPELMAAIGWWKAGTYTTPELMTTIGRWKAGGY